jgi:hypothetical protein
MARNQNRQKSEKTKVFPAPLALILTAVASLALGHLWLTDRCDQLGRRIKELEQQKAQLKKQVEVEELNWSAMTTYEKMEEHLRRHNLVMDWPAEKNIVRLHRGEARNAAPALAGGLAQFALRSGDQSND